MALTWHFLPCVQCSVLNIVQCSAEFKVSDNDLRGIMVNTTNIVFQQNWKLSKEKEEIEEEAEDKEDEAEDEKESDEESTA